MSGTPETGPIGILEATQAYMARNPEDPMNAAPVESAPTEAPAEDAPLAEEPVTEDAEAVEAAADEVEDAPEDAPEASEEQVLTVDEYGDVQVQVGDDVLTLSDLIAGATEEAGLRQEDYTRKTQALADERRAFEAEVVAFDSRINEERSSLAHLSPEQLFPYPPEEFGDSNPAEYRQAKRRVDNLRASFSEQVSRGLNAKANFINGQLADIAPGFTRKVAQSGLSEDEVNAMSDGMAAAGYHPREMEFAVRTDPRIGFMAVELAKARAAAEANKPVKNVAAKLSKPKRAPVLRPGSRAAPAEAAAAERARTSKTLDRPHSLAEHMKARYGVDPNVR